MKKSTVIWGVASWLIFVLLYLLFAGKPQTDEAVAGALAATFALLLVHRLRARFKRPLLVKLPWLVLLWRIPLATLSECWFLCVALFRRLRGSDVEGRMLEHPFSTTEERHDSARRAFMTFGVCITPNSYLVYLDRERGRVLIRQLVGPELSKIDRLFVELS